MRKTEQARGAIIDALDGMNPYEQEMVLLDILGDVHQACRAMSDRSVIDGHGEGVPMRDVIDALFPAQAMRARILSIEARTDIDRAEKDTLIERCRLRWP